MAVNDAAPRALLLHFFTKKPLTLGNRDLYFAKLFSIGSVTPELQEVIMTSKRNYYRALEIFDLDVPET